MFPRLHVARPLAIVTAAVLVYTAIVTYIVKSKTLPTWELAEEITTVLTAFIGVLIVFRNNAANDRWWEARKLWGQLINDTRNLALKARTYATLDGSEQRDFANLLIGFAHALRLHLRGKCELCTVPGFESDTTIVAHAPGYIAGRAFEALASWDRSGKLLTSVWLLDRHAGAFMDICGACERIKNTPLASSYRALLRATIILNFLLAPWAAAAWAGWLSLPVVGVACAVLFGVELAAEAIEEPFGTTGDDLPLEKYCETIDRFVSETLNGSTTYAIRAPQTQSRTDGL